MSLHEVTGATRLLGVIADPVAQARSPGLLNALLAERGRLGELVLVPLHVAAGGLADATAGLRAIQNFAGAIVSMPHKQAIVALLDERTPEAQQIGAVNVIRRARDGRLAGAALDGEGFVAGLRAAGHDVRDRDCLLVGAGGAGAAIAFALAKHGCRSLAVANRTPARAEELAARVRAAHPGLAVRGNPSSGGRYDLAVNATSLGMRAADPLPLGEDEIARCALVAECVLAPERTALLDVARRLGAATHGGLAMLRAQLALMLDFMLR